LQIAGVRTISGCGVRFIGAVRCGLRGQELNMRVKVIGAAAIVCLVAGAEGALALGGDKAIIEALGIDGRWAESCRQPASAENPYLVFETFRDGPPVQRRLAPPDEEGEKQLLDVAWQKTAREITWVIPEGEVMLTVTSRMDGNRMRVISVVTSDGVKLVTEARDDSGKPTPWLTKCETN